MNMKYIFAFLAFSITAPALAQQDPFARDLKIISQWFEGNFDNKEQLWFQMRMGVPEDERHERIHTVHVPWDAPQFGEHVFYVEEYAGNDPENVIRQRIVIFSSDLEEGAIRMRQGFFRDQEAVKGAHLDSSLLDGIGEDDVFFLDTCHVFWHRKADQFEGAMKPKACKLGMTGGPPRYSVHNLTLSESKYWRVDSSFLEADDSLYLGEPVDEPFEMRRANKFVCDVTFRGTLKDGPVKGEEYPVNGLTLHDQGGISIVTNPVSGLPYQLMIQTKEYDFYEDRPDFKFFSIREPGNIYSVGYVVTDSVARMVGTNLGWMSAYCHRDGYTFREHWEELP